jgi:hypothetical protein
VTAEQQVPGPAEAHRDFQHEFENHSKAEPIIKTVLSGENAFVEIPYPV